MAHQWEINYLWLLCTNIFKYETERGLFMVSAYWGYGICNNYDYYYIGGKYISVVTWRNELESIRNVSICVKLVVFLTWVMIVMIIKRCFYDGSYSNDCEDIQASIAYSLIQYFVRFLIQWSMVTPHGDMDLISFGSGCLLDYLIVVYNWSMNNKIQPNFNQNSSMFSREMLLKMWSAKWHPFWSDLNVLINAPDTLIIPWQYNKKLSVLEDIRGCYLLWLHNQVAWLPGLSMQIL